MRLLGRDLRVAVAAFLFAALPGCKQILGLEDRGMAEPTDSGGGPVVINPVSGTCGELRHPFPSCAACMDTNCCAEAEACHGDPACDAAYDCNTMCGDDASCRSRCNTFFTRADTLVDINACRESKCKAVCGNACGGFGYNASGCDKCVKQTCCSAATTCAQNADCVKLELCRTNCIAGSLSCPTECEKTFAGGFDVNAPWSQCVQNTCAEECQPGRNWQSLDAKAPWLKPKSGGLITISVNIVDVVNEPPFAGASVRACKKLDLSCAEPLDTQTTDAQGFASVTVPAGSVGFDGYLEFAGGDNGTGHGVKSEVFPAIWYPSPNVISSGWRGRIQFVSRESLEVLAVLTGAKIDPERGHFAAAAQDCNFATAGNVSFEAGSTRDVGTTVFYFVGGAPKTDATKTDPLSGIGGFINLLAGQLSYITAVVPVGDQVKSLGSAAYIIRPGTFTTTSFPPIP